MTKLITLSSGNKFYFAPEGNGYAAHALVTDSTGTQFLGGFATEEAKRKFACWSKTGTLHPQEVEMPNVSDMDLSVFCTYIGRAASSFREFASFTFNDLDDCNGKNNSAADSCDERQHYYNAVGMSCLFKTRLKLPYWAFVANHLSIFGRELFHLTWRNGYEEGSSDSVVSHSEITVRMRYCKDSFKAPAYYAACLCRYWNSTK